MSAETTAIRPTATADADRLFNLTAALPPLTTHTWYTYWNLVNNFGNSCFIAEDDDYPVGFITSHPTTQPSQEWFIWQAGIIPDYRGTGLVDRLQDRVVSAAREAGATAIRTTIEADNPRSLGAFNRMAKRLGMSMVELSRFETPASDVPEVLYRISLEE